MPWRVCKLRKATRVYCFSRSVISDFRFHRAESSGAFVEKVRRTDTTFFLWLSCCRVRGGGGGQRVGAWITRRALLFFFFFLFCLLQVSAFLFEALFRGPQFPGWKIARLRVIWYRKLQRILLTTGMMPTTRVIVRKPCRIKTSTLDSLPVIVSCDRKETLS